MQEVVVLDVVENDRCQGHILAVLVALYAHLFTLTNLSVCKYEAFAHHRFLDSHAVIKWRHSKPVLEDWNVDMVRRTVFSTLRKVDGLQAVKQRLHVCQSHDLISRVFFGNLGELVEYSLRSREDVEGELKSHERISLFQRVGGDSPLLNVSDDPVKECESALQAES